MPPLYASFVQNRENKNPYITSFASKAEGYPHIHLIEDRYVDTIHIWQSCVDKTLKNYEFFKFFRVGYYGNNDESSFMGNSLYFNKCGIMFLRKGVTNG